MFCNISVCPHFSSGLASPGMTSTRAGKPWQHPPGLPSPGQGFTRAGRPWPRHEPGAVGPGGAAGPGQGINQGQPALVKALTRASRPWAGLIRPGLGSDQGWQALAMAYPGPVGPVSALSGLAGPVRHAHQGLPALILFWKYAIIKNNNI